MDELQETLREILDTIKRNGGNFIKMGGAIMDSDEKLAGVLNDMTDFIKTPAGGQAYTGIGQILSSIGGMAAFKSITGGKLPGVLGDTEGTSKVLTMMTLLTEGIKEMGSFYMDNGKTYVELLSEFDSNLRDVNKKLGNSGILTQNLRQNMADGAEAVAKFGLRFDDVLGFQREYNKELRTSRSLLRDELEILGKISEGTGLGRERTAELVFALEKYSMVASRSQAAVERQLELSQKYGINAKQALSSTVDLVEKAQGFRFKEGLSDIFEMAAKAEAMKMDVNAMFGSMEKARGLEGALQMATDLQMMGINVDPLRLNFLARNDPEGYMETLGNITDRFGAINKMTGELTIPPAQLDIMRSVANATGQTVANLKEQAVQRRMLGAVQRQNPMVSEEDAQFLSRMAKFQDGELKIQVAGGNLKSISDVVEKDIKALRASATQNLEQIAMDSQGIAEMENAARASAIASMGDYVQSIGTTIDTMHDGRRVLKDYMRQQGFAEKQVEAFGNGLIAVMGNMYRSAQSVDTSTVMGSLAVNAQQLAQATDFMKFTPKEMGEYRDMMDGVINSIDNGIPLIEKLYSRMDNPNKRDGYMQASVKQGIIEGLKEAGIFQKMDINVKGEGGKEMSPDELMDMLARYMDSSKKGHK